MQNNMIYVLNQASIQNWLIVSLYCDNFGMFLAILTYLGRFKRVASRVGFSEQFLKCF